MTDSWNRWQIYRGMIPNKIHFIWLGSNLPNRHQQRILQWSQHHRFTYAIYLWVDSASLPIGEDLNTTKQFCEKYNIRFRDINTLQEYSCFVACPYYNDWISGTNFEEIDGYTLTHRTYAYAANALRIEILICEGGIYSDIDSICNGTLKLNHTYGFQAWGIEVNGTYRIDDNCLIAATPNHDVLKACRINIQYCYNAFVIDGKDSKYQLLDPVELSLCSNKTSWNIAHGEEPTGKFAHLVKPACRVCAYAKLRIKDPRNDNPRVRTIGAVPMIWMMNKMCIQLYGNTCLKDVSYIAGTELTQVNEKSWSGINLSKRPNLTMQAIIQHSECKLKCHY